MSDCTHQAMLDLADSSAGGEGMSLAKFLVCAVAITSVVSLAKSVSLAQSFEWQVATPDSQGMSGPALDMLKDRLAAVNTKALFVVRNDRLVYEWYSAD